MTDQKAAVFPFDVSTLISTGISADRFTYSSYFVPVRVTFADDPDTPALTFPQREWISQFGSRLPDEVMNRWLGDLGLTALASRNGFEIRPPAVEAPADVSTSVGTPGTSVHDAVEDLRALSHIIATTLAPGQGSDLSALLSSAVSRVERETATSSAAATAAPQGSLLLAPSPGLHEVGSSVAQMNGASVRSPAEEAKDLLLMLVQSEIGYLFLDRTRIRPKGFAVGEHVYSLSLTPAEEVTLEQKSYSKRTGTMEEADEREQSMDMELSSTLTSEIDESMERTSSLTDKWGLNVSHGGAYKTPDFFWGSINANHSIAFTKDVTEASTETARRSTKDSRSLSSKIAAKYRSLHKVSFSTKTETGFESTSKRVIRNQNRFTPVDYHFFKILRIVELSHERYGAMLCWAPFVRRPASQFFARVNAGKSEVRSRTEAQIPAEPQPPVQTGAAGSKTKRAWSNQVEADRWGTLGEMSAIYTLTIPIPQGWEWPGDAPAISDVSSHLRVSTVYVTGSPTAAVVGTPWSEGSLLKVMVSVNLKNAWDRGDVNKPSKIYLMVGANLTQTTPDPVDAAAYTAAYAQFVTQHQAWAEDADKRRAGAADEAAAWEASMLESSSPVNELVNRLISDNFRSDIQDAGAAIELWQRIFQWDAASYVLYPGWWADEPLRDPLGDPNSFFNASWARLFLPVRPGMEEIALRWIYSKTTTRPLRAGLTDTVTELVKGLNDYREAHYATTMTPPANGGCPTVEEGFQCLGKWEESLPTDGTHVEVTQSASLSIDAFARADLEDTAKLREAVLESRKQDAVLKGKAADHIDASTGVEVKIHTDAGADGSSA